MVIRPVLDVRGGRAVRAVAGRRDRYTPWNMPWCRSADPLTFARRLRDRWGTNRLYVADLDALEGDGPGDPRANRAIWFTLADDGFDLLLDAGVRHPGDLRPSLTPADSRLVVPTETARSLEELCGSLAASGGVLGLDLRDGKPIGPGGVLAFARSSGAPVLLLDVAAVGLSGGVPTLPLVRELLAANPSRDVRTGGGVRSIEDVREAAAAGVSELLVATALYEGRLSRDDLRPYLAPPA